jgi:hypothetical protein
MADFNAELRTWGLLEPAESTERLLLSDASVQCSQFVLPEMDAVGGALQAHLLEPTEFLQGQCVQAARELVDKVLRAHPPDTFLPDQPYFELCGVAAASAAAGGGGSSAGGGGGGAGGGGGRLSPVGGNGGGGDDGAAVVAAAGKKRSGFSSLLRATTLSGATSSSSHSHVHSGSGGTGGGIGGVSSSSSSAAAVDVAELAALNDAREGVALVVSVAQGWDTCKRVRSSLLLQQMLRGAKAMAQHVRVAFFLHMCIFMPLKKIYCATLFFC